MASAPDMADIRAVLHDAGQMGTAGGERFQLVVGSPDENSRLAAETENLAAVLFHFLRLERKRNRMGGGFFDFRRNEIAAQWINHGNDKRAGCGAQKPVEKFSPPVIEG